MARHVQSLGNFRGGGESFDGWLAVPVGAVQVSEGIDMKRFYTLVLLGMIAAAAVGCAREASVDNDPYIPRHFRGGDHGGGRD